MEVIFYPMKAIENHRNLKEAVYQGFKVLHRSKFFADEGMAKAPDFSLDPIKKKEVS
jgi:hypothetical protein